MNILYLSRSLLPSKAANSVHVMKMCQALAKNGNEVTLVASGRGRCPADSIYDFYGVEPVFKIIMLKGRSDKPAGLSRYLLSFYLYIRKAELPDIIYGRDPFTLAVAAWKMKIPFYYEAHKPPTTLVHSFLTRRLLKNKNLVKLVVITNSLKQEYRKIFPGQPDQKVLVAPDGADIPDRAKTNNKVKSIERRIVIGYVGHLYSGRGIEIIHELARRLPQYEFHLVGGEGKDIAYWQKKCRDIKNICFKGFVPNKELYRYYSNMDIVLAPYQAKVSIHGGLGDTSRWMSPLKIFEYMAFARPIIASDLPVLQEVLTHGHNALLCNPDYIDEWLNAVKLLSENTVLRNRIARNAFDCCKGNYTWKSRAARILNH